jgi:hypothetical protein
MNILGKTSRRGEATGGFYNRSSAGMCALGGRKRSSHHNPSPAQDMFLYVPIISEISIYVKYNQIFLLFI